MDSFEINKILATVLVVFLVVFGIGKISDLVFHVEKPNTSAYIVGGGGGFAISVNLARL